ncbi:MAG: BlaI/MecI/CopY family transcriptional regulator [Pirellulales bacterium]
MQGRVTVLLATTASRLTLDDARRFGTLTTVVVQWDPSEIAVMPRPEGKLTAAQYEIMELVWDAGGEGLTVSEIWDAIGQRRELTRTTIQNLVERLEKRRWLKRSKAKGGSRYVATTDRVDTARALAETFVDEFFAGSASDLVMSLFGSKRLKQQDLVRMRELLDSQLKKRKAQK